MGFFNWSPEEGQTILSPWVWLYFVVTAGFTLVTMSVWYLYNSMKHRKYDSDVEMQSIRTGTSLFRLDTSKQEPSVACSGSPGAYASK